MAFFYSANVSVLRRRGTSLLLAGAFPMLAGWLGLCCLLFVGPARLRAEEPEGSLTQGRLSIGFLKSVFAGVNRSDAEAAFKALLETAARRRGYVAKRSAVFEDAVKLEAAIKDGTINLAVVDAWAFLRMDVRSVARPCFVPQTDGRIGRKHLLLTLRGSSFQNVANLRGQSLLQYVSVGGDASQVWLQNLLAASQCPAAGQFFGECEWVSRPSLALLPVFFGKKSACVVDENGFAVMKELNPQVGEKLQVVASSEPLLDSVVLIQEGAWAGTKGKDDLLVALAELHQEPAGQQILTLFRIERLVPFEEKHLDALRRLQTNGPSGTAPVRP